MKHQAVFGWLSASRPLQDTRRAPPVSKEINYAKNQNIEGKRVKPVSNALAASQESLKERNSTVDASVFCAPSENLGPVVLSGGEPGPFATPLQGLNTVKRALCAGRAGMPVELSVFRKQTAKVNGTFEQVPVGILCSLEPLPCAAPSMWSTRERVTHSQ
ncbi:hypothetical protein Q8A67_018458 [Cirrhinus molitorella]|uniref:Uncharacterized protein n=1 Tax=Cirrhinus molitorella TaxID=172907 RepID=A0AA88TQR9_9TELE|nr:hypothetical protein Q8A67_018458 [Cirrhinus molitorella]